MPNFKVVDMTGKEVGSIELSDAVFGAEVNADVLHTAVKVYLANQRQGTQSTLTRAEVSGGGANPGDKGHRTRPSRFHPLPQWTHGGVALGPKPAHQAQPQQEDSPHSHSPALSSKVQSGSVVVIDSIEASEYKTKTMVGMLKAVGAKKKALVALASVDDKVIKSMSNIPGVKTVQAGSINAYDILNCDTFIMAKDAAVKIDEVYA